MSWVKRVSERTFQVKKNAVKKCHHEGSVDRSLHVYINHTSKLGNMLNLDEQDYPVKSTGPLKIE